MAHILMVWELGGHLGHLSRLASLADELHQRGHHISLALRELHNAESVFGKKSPYDFFQAPIFLSPLKPSRNPVTYTEILQCNGYLSSSSLRYTYQAWRSLYSTLKPDIIIFDYAPTAMMAARGLDVGKIQLGTGFFIPPEQSPMPLFGGANAPSLKQRKENDKLVIDTINHILSSENIAPITRIYDLFNDTLHLITSFQELDYFASRKNAEYVGILTKVSLEKSPKWPTEKKHRRVFAYLKPNYTNITSMLHVLKQANIEARIYIPHCPQTIKASFESSQMIFSDAPYTIEEAITGADIVICHAGHDTIVHALLQGKPLLLIPQYIEQLEAAKCCAAIKAGLVANPSEDQESLSKKIEMLCQNAIFRENAEAFAKRYQHLRVENSIALVAEKCEEVLAKKQMICSCS